MMSTGKTGRLNRVALFVLLAPGVLAGLQAVSVPADAAPPAVRPAVLAASAAPRLPVTATRVGAMDAARQVRLTVSLKVRDQAGLSALLAGLADPKSPYYHHYLSKGQFGPMFGPTRAQVAAVRAALRAAGLSPGPVSADRLRIPVTATAAQVRHAFGTILVNYRLPGGRIAFANATAPKVDASVAPLVNGISGLNDLYLPKPASLHRAPPTAGQAPWTRRPGIARALTTTAAAGPTACDAADNADPLTMNFWANYYGMTPLYDLGDLGQGQRIALLELEPNLPSDISAFESCYGISTPVNYIPVDGGVTPGGPGYGEAALDIDTVAGLAPQATINVYQAPDRVTDIDDIMGRFVLDDTDSTLSVSWALCQTLTPPADLEDEADWPGRPPRRGRPSWRPPVTSAHPGLRARPADASRSIHHPLRPTWSLSAARRWQLPRHRAGLERPDHGATAAVSRLHVHARITSTSRLIPGLFDAQLAMTSSDLRVRPRHRRDSSGRRRTCLLAYPRHRYGIFHDGRWTGDWSARAPRALWAAIAALTNASPYCAAYGSGNPGVLPMALYAMTAAQPVGHLRRDKAAEPSGRHRRQQRLAYPPAATVAVPRRPSATTWPPGSGHR